MALIFKAAATFGLSVIGFAALMASPATAAQKLQIEKNHSTRVSLSAPAGNVIVGNPDIADVTVVDTRTIFIVGRSFGRSGVTITDKYGRVIFDSDVVVGQASNGKGVVNVYKGLKASSVVCSQICQPQDDAAGGPATEVATVP
ncbi:pilus assembly protein N-terminal domain-containing protein [Asticcacaulis machinosus]|uniref:Pilus assembly protein N-terminal domain-containing protein n=1 Tax=Asticcacaulis machinosus TaxID=2984211 RepID=A0ABT5HLV3_9CAUL|nr:pilus assembly protein N-terminal domain-containing protein [Asticcacaulis machinosus]MDC7677126.1 pilus assembly protein N-terminal domain-containing protein [Asticcacaulis machinosus]